MRFTFRFMRTRRILHKTSHFKIRISCNQTAGQGITVICYGVSTSYITVIYYSQLNPSYGSRWFVRDLATPYLELHTAHYNSELALPTITEKQAS